MTLCHTANSHFALLLPPGLTSQCISSIMQRHWDPFHCVPPRVPCTQRSPSMIPRQALQRALVQQWDHRYSINPAWLPPWAWWLDYHTSRVHLESSFLGHLKWHPVSQEGALSHSQSVARKRRRRKRRRRRWEGSPRIQCAWCREPRAKHWQNEGEEWEGREGERGVWGGGTEGGVKHCKAGSQSHVSQSHEPGWVGGWGWWKYLQTHSGHAS